METKNNSVKQFEDVRDETFENRTTIGFSSREDWKNSKAHFEEHALTIQGHPVMEDWEEPYMKELASVATSGSGTVLEVGFGMGISARHIQRSSIQKHIIIEANKEVFKKLEEFANESPHETIPLFGFWEEITPTLSSGSISGILFDTYPLSEKEIHTNHFPFLIEAYRLLKPGGVLTYYSDEIDSYSSAHLTTLSKAGFTDIEKRICEVEPPENCLYWKSKTILVPIIRK